MHFLCLHGAGTNAKIFESQTAALRYELGGGHTYHFVEGVVTQQKAPGIGILAAPGEPCFAYYRPHSADSFTAAVGDLKNYIERDGPFDGVVAFSQGASLAGALLLDRVKSCTLGLRCAIFLCGRDPFNELGGAGSILSPTVHGGHGLIEMPTAHIWGIDDKTEPGQASALSELCRIERRHIYIHTGGHEVPGPRDHDGLVESANTIRRMLAQL